MLTVPCSFLCGKRTRSGFGHHIVIALVIAASLVVFVHLLAVPLSRPVEVPSTFLELTCLLLLGGVQEGNKEMSTLPAANY